MRKKAEQQGPTRSAICNFGFGASKQSTSLSSPKAFDVISRNYV